MPAGAFALLNCSPDTTRHPGHAVRESKPQKDAAMRVLLVDDDANARRITRRMLERSGHVVAESENGLHGVAQFRAASFDLVVTDIVMPVMDGLEFIKTARQLAPSVKVVAMSGGGRTSSTDYLETARLHGASATLHKPFTLTDLTDSIDQCFGGKAA
jgi:CheY-like chemotaxis protein